MISAGPGAQGLCPLVWDWGRWVVADSKSTPSRGGLVDLPRKGVLMNILKPGGLKKKPDVERWISSGSPVRGFYSQENE